MNHTELHVAGPVATITLNRPDKRNPLSRDTVVELRSTFADLAFDQAVRVIVLAGKGSAFSAGADLEEMDAMRSAPMSDHTNSSGALADLFLAMRGHPKPIIARVNGHAIAGGAGLALACDFAIAVEHARIGFTEVRIGFVPAIVSALARGSVIDKRLRELLLTGRLLEAGEAVRYGLLTKSVDPAQLDSTVNALIETIVHETSATAIAMTKRLLAATEGMPLGPAFKFLSAYNALARSTDDCKDGIAAFLEKRDPPWKK